MPTYTVKDPTTGRTVKLTGDSPPSETELTEIFAKLPAAAQAPTEEPAAGPEGSAIRRFASNLGEQLNPITMAKGVYSAVRHPVDTYNAAVDASAQQFGQARQAFQEGRYSEAIGHGAAGALPVIGPAAAQAGEQIGSGDVAGGLGKGVGLVAPFAAGPVVGAARRAIPAPAAAAVNETVAFARARGIPLDAATVSDNLAVKGTQALVDRGTLGGAAVATPAKATQAAAMTRVGGELLDTAHPGIVTPEMAGASLRDALTTKVAGHNQAATAAYERLRELEQQPGNRMTMPGKATPVDGLSDDLRGQVRRIVHELDAVPFKPGKLMNDEPGISSGTHYDPRSAGAEVFHDVVGQMSEGANPTRAVVQNQLEAYLAGGPQTPAVKAALEVAAERARGRGGASVSKPLLPPTAMDLPTRLEGVSRGQEMGFPVDLKSVKVILQPIYDQMTRQMPITQQQANPGLKAIENIVKGDDFAPLSQADRDLGAIKAVARSHGGLAKVAAQKFEAAIQQAVGYAPPEVRATLQRGREATIAKYTATDVLERLHAEPVKTIDQLTAPRDTAITRLRAVAEQAPEQIPGVSRAYLEGLLEKPQKVAEWSKLGAETKATLFPDPGHVQALDQFFKLTDRISKTNVNPSGSGYMAAMGAQGGMMIWSPITQVPMQIGAAVVAKLLRSEAAVDALTQGLRMPKVAAASTRLRVATRLVNAAAQVGVHLDVPGLSVAAETQTPDPRLEGVGTR